MENLTLIGILVFYGVAGVLLLIGGIITATNRETAGQPPALPTGKVGTWIYQPTDMIILAVIAGFFLLSATSGAMVPKEDLKITKFALIFNICIQVVLAAGCALAVFRRVKISEWLGLRWREWPWVFLIAPAAVLGMWLVFAGLMAAGYMDFFQRLGIGDMQETVETLQKEKDPVILGLMAFVAVIIAPVCEEIFFRGFMHPVAKRFSGRWVGTVAVALIFAAAHGNAMALFPLFIFAMILALIYDYTGSIWAPIAAHMLFNGATVAAQFAMRYGLIPDQV